MKTYLKKVLLSLGLFSIVFSFYTQRANANLPDGEMNDKGLKNLQKKADKYLSAYKINDALFIYLELLKEDPENANFNFKTGLCYLNSFDEQKKAIPYLKKAINDITFDYLFFDKEQKKAPVDALYFLGKVYMTINKPDSALKYINLFTQEYLKKVEKFNYITSSEVYSNIQKCNFANTARYYEFDINRKLLDSVINSDFSETNPVLFDHGRQMFFCSDRPKDTSSNDLNIYYTSFQNGRWEVPKAFKYSSINDEIPVYVNNANDEFYLSVESKKNNRDLFVSHKIDGEWSQPEKLNAKINSTYNEISLAISKDKATMLIASDRKGGFGGYDIYMLTLQENGSWGKPINLEAINTKYDEISPSFSETGDTIYYTSNCEIKDLGLGGYDIYFAPILNEKIGKPSCLKFPINGLTHDRDLCLAHNGNAYFSSINKNKKFDIFIVEGFTPNIKLIKVYKPDAIELANQYTELFSNNLAGFKNEGKGNMPIIKEIESQERLGYINTGNIQDLDKIIATEIIEKESEVEVEKVIEIEKEVEKLVEVEKVLETEKEVEKLVEINNVVEVEKIVNIIKTGETKIVYIDINQLNEADKEVVVKELVKTIEVENKPSVETIINSLEFLSKAELNNEQKQLIIGKLKNYISINDQAELIKPSKKVSGELIDVVEFNYNSYFLNYSQVKQIKRLAKKLAKLDNYTLELVGHCDSSGDFNINKDISIKRAKAVCEQLKLNNIHEDNIIFYGKGSYEPITSNNDDDSRSKNRRVEIFLHSLEKKNESVTLNTK